MVWGLEGGLPSCPHGLWLERDGVEEFLGAVFSDVPIKPGDRFRRGTAGGGGLGDPLRRDPARVLEDLADDYVSLARARKDYGVIAYQPDPDLAEYVLDAPATQAERARIARA